VRRTSPFPILAATGLVAAMTLGPQLVSAEITGSFVAGADADLIELSGVAIPPGCGDEPAELFGFDEGIDCDFELTTLRVGDTETGNNTEGGLSNGIEDDLVSFGHGSNTDVELLTAGGVDGNIAADLVLQADAYQPGGPEEDDDQLGEAPDNPLIGGDLFTVSASATDIGAGNTQCPDEDEFRVSHGFNETLNLRLGPGQMPEGGDVLAVEGVSYALSQVDLVDSLVGTVGDNAYGVRSTAEVDLATIQLLDGNLQLEIVKPRLVATHDGDEFSWTYDAPDVVLTAGGEQILDGTILDQLDDSVLTPLLEGLEPLTDELEPLLKVNLHVKQAEEVEVAGNTATVSDVVFLSIELLNAMDEEAGGIEVLSLSIGDLSVTAEAPEGGVIVDCAQPPLTVVKDGPETVVAGDSFDYTITVTNELECTATDIAVVDTITGPAGFSVTSTDPTADSVEDGVISWEVDELAPGESVVFTVTIQVPADAAPGSEFANTATADANCDDQPLPRGQDTLEGPTVLADTDVIDEDIQLPRTGGSLALLAMGALAAAGALGRRW
jgi:uncharacterized repeat protein (TIGR01451 family)